MAEKEKTLLFSVSASDCIRQSYSIDTLVNKTWAGVRLTHPPSGAVGQSHESRSVRCNTRAAFARMVDTKEFKTWRRVEVARRLGQLGQPVRLSDDEIRALVDRRIDEDLANGLIVEEVIPRQPYRQVYEVANAG